SGVGGSTRDLMALALMLDRYAMLERPVFVTAVGAPSQPVTDTQKEDAFREAGWWRAPWSPTMQSEFARDFTALALSRPFVHSVAWQDLYDTPRRAREMPYGGLLNASGEPKPVARALIESRKAVRDGRLAPGFLSLS